MRLLLDTHIWLWVVGEPGRLKPRVLRQVERGANELWLSPLSVWEVLLLVERRRISVSGAPQEWVSEALARIPVKEAPVTLEVALAIQHIVLPHHDPVDRFLAATARVFDLMLVTADARLLQGRGFTTLPNR